MKKSVIITLLGFLILAFPIISYYLNRAHHKKVRSSPQMYIYETFSGQVNGVLYIENLKYREALIEFYDAEEKDPNAKNKIKFPINGLTIREPVYIINYTNDSLLAEFVSYIDWGRYWGGNYTRGWVYVKTLHKDPPAESKK